MAAKEWIFKNKKNWLMTWLLWGTGILFCLTGAYLFYKNVFEENKKILPSILMIIMGVILIAAGTAKYVHLIK